MRPKQPLTLSPCHLHPFRIPLHRSGNSVAVRLAISSFFKPSLKSPFRYMIFCFFTFEVSFQLSADGSLESSDVVGEEGALGVGGDVTTAAVARDTRAVGYSGIALVRNPLGVAGALATAATASAARDNPVEAGGLLDPEFLVSSVVRPCLVLHLSKPKRKG